MHLVHHQPAWLTRSVSLPAWCCLQTFAKTDNPAILFNGNNEYLHYQDTWYILGYKPDSYVVSICSTGMRFGSEHLTISAVPCMCLTASRHSQGVVYGHCASSVA